jgi:hypothetical protein
LEAVTGAADPKYRWWLLDGDLDIVSDGKIGGGSLLSALADVSQELRRLSDSGKHPINHPYRLIVYRGASVVAVRPASIGIC